MGKKDKLNGGRKNSVFICLDIFYQRNHNWITNLPFLNRLGRNGRVLLILEIILLNSVISYSTVTDLAKFLGWSTSVPLKTATW